ncbi:MAG: hypothetical protein GY841_07585, partial [FCB group bacterium]|nr:hypothetical protein [FCB group bacterium]
MNRRYPVAIIAIIIAGFLSTSLSAGILTAPLQDRLSNFTADSDDFVRVVIIPVSNHDSKAMKSSLSRSFKTRADRHRVGVAQLKAVADQSQVSAKAELARLESNGAARRVKTFWITNLI